MTKAIVSQNNSPSTGTGTPLQEAIGIVTYNLSDTSRRQYVLTFRKWMAFCAENGLHPAQMTAGNIIRFLDSDNLAHRTKQARLSHLRKLLEALHAMSPGNQDIESLYKQIQLLRVKRSETEKQSTEHKHIENRLTTEQVFEALRYYGDETRLHTRNRAMLAILLFCGLRRAELVALQWDDIDMTPGKEQIHVKHGKGDKERFVPIIGGLKYIRDWHFMTAGRTFVFCGIRKGDKFREDKPVATNAVWRVLKPVEAALGLEGLSPHDARRTVITDMIESGTPVNVVQAFVGHANAQTTLGYAKRHDAETLRAKIKLSYN